MCSGCSGDYFGGPEEFDPDATIPNSERAAVRGDRAIFVSAQHIVVYAPSGEGSWWRPVEEVLPPALPASVNVRACLEMATISPSDSRPQTGPRGQHSTSKIAKYYQTLPITYRRSDGARKLFRISLMGIILAVFYGGTLLVGRIW